jgi:hypothetical protein
MSTQFYSFLQNFEDVGEVLAALQQGLVILREEFIRRPAR